ncbi:hypothetical protein ACJZ2D_002249 [Fusarium nematophilum]
MPAPYSDNLYSGDASDDEPDALSPTDGYFHASSSGDASSSSRNHHHHRLNVPHVPNVLVEDPTVQSRESKAREVERERQLLSRGGPAASSDSGSRGYQTSPVTRGHQHRRSVDEDGSIPGVMTTSPPSHTQQQQPLHLFPHHADAPPAYTPSPTTTTSPSTTTNYQTFAQSATMGRPDDQQLLIHHPPESMSSPPDSDKPSRWRRFRDGVTSVDLRSRIKTILGSLVIFSVVFMIFSSFTMIPNHDHGPPGRHADNDPVKSPDKKPDDFTWDPPRACFNSPHRFDTVKTYTELRYTRNLSIVQTIERDNNGRSGWNPHVFGEVILRPADGSLPPYIELQVISNHESLGVKVEYDEDTQLFKMITPQRVSWDVSTQAPCIQIRATVWVPRDSIINALGINTLHLDVDVKEGFVLGVMQGVAIHSTSGDVRTPSLEAGSKDDVVVLPYTLSSREIRVHTTSGDVKGWYPLYDLLDIQTVSGDVAASIGPKPADPQGVRPAELRVRSSSGAITLDEPIDRAAQTVRPDRAFPPRDYIVDLVTASGDITASLAASSIASFKSQSGDLKLRLWPVLDSGLLAAAEGKASNKPALETDTKSGITQVTILEPLWTSLATIGEAIPPLVPDDPEDEHEPYLVMPPRSHGSKSGGDEFSIADAPALSVLSSKHRSISGDIKLRYPSSWEGHVFAQTISGAQDFRGEGLQVTHEGGPFARLIKGRKGKGYSQLDVNTVSGDEDVLIGKEVSKRDTAR